MSGTNVVNIARKVTLTPADHVGGGEVGLICSLSVTMWSEGRGGQINYKYKDKNYPIKHKSKLFKKSS